MEDRVRRGRVANRDPEMPFRHRRLAGSGEAGSGVVGPGHRTRQHQLLHPLTQRRHQRRRLFDPITQGALGNRHVAASNDPDLAM